MYDQSMRGESISEQLRLLRKRAGLSVSRLARRAGTSAPTVSRYEGGWSRFEVYTLRKLARALGYRLRVTFEPMPGADRAVYSRKALVQRIKRLFWDRPLRETDLDRYRSWVVKRVLEYGALEDIRTLGEVLGQAELLACAARISFDSRETAALWRQLAELEEIPCTSGFSREEAASFWPS